MRKALLAFTGIVLVAAVAWTGLWFYGKSRIVQEIEAQAQLFREQGNEMSYEGIDIGGFPLGYTGRIAAPRATMSRPPQSAGQSAERYAWSAPWIEASATVMAPDTVTFTFPKTQEILLGLPEAGTSPLPVSLTSQGLTVTTTRKDGDILFTGMAQTMGGAFSHLSQKSGMVDVAWAVRDIDLSGKAAEDRPGTSGPQLALTYAVADLDSTITIAGGDAAPGGTVRLKGGAITGSGDSLGAETTGIATMADLGASLQFESLGAVPLDIGIGTIGIETRLPNDAATDAQPFAYRVRLEDITIADLIWAMIDPQAAFPREINELVIDIEGDAIFSAAPSNPEAFAKAMESGLPIDVDTLRLKDITVDALGLKATGKGEGSLSGDAPQGAGTLAIEGFAGFMNSLVKSGRIPPQQAMVVQLMVESFGKSEEGSDAIQFDFEARDGMMYVNTIPIGEAPAIPR